MRRRATLAAAAALVVAHKAEPVDAHVRGCHSKACDRRVHLKRRHHWALAHPWLHAWHHLTAGDRSWLRRTAWCESGNRAHTNTGNGFYGLVQFSLPTARAAGFTVRPDLAGWYEQAVRAVRWAHRAGRGQWPVCG